MEPMKPEIEEETPGIQIPETPVKPNYKKDIKSILLLFALYILQGIPLGLIATVPFLLLSRGVSYAEQAKFSLAHWPYSFKVLYAPIIDAVYYQRLGRRKSWLVPLQYLVAIFLLTIALLIEDFLSTGNVTALTAMFFILNFLAASQDVAVDGWALTMLSPENLGYASTCNAVGLILGSTMGYSGFLLLESAKFANNFRSVPGDTGLVTIPQYLIFWAIVFALTTTLILIFKAEAKESQQVADNHMDIIGSYKSLWKILKLRNVQIFALVLLTLRVGMAATDALSKLKLVASGVPKETIAFFSIPLIPVKLLLPIFIAKWTTGSNPMRLYVNTIPLSLCFGIIYPIIVYLSPGLKSTETGIYGMGFYVFLFGIFALELIPSFTRFVAGMAFFAKISDPTIGGTYMTLLNTISNVGGTWPSTLALWLVDYIAIPLNNGCSEIVNEALNASSLYANDTDYYLYDSTATSLEYIEEENSTLNYNISAGGEVFQQSVDKCVSKIDGYYVLSVFCVIFGFLWLIWGRRTILGLQKKPKSSWRVFLTT